MKVFASCTLVMLCTIVFGADPLVIADTRPKISVTGSASIEVPPDHVDIRISVSTVDKSYEKAQEENTKKVISTMSMLESLGISKKDMATGYVSLRKKEVERENKTPLFLGYEASTQISFMLRDMSKYDHVIASLTKNGAFDLENVSFGILNEIEKRKEARLMAIKAAKEKAEYLAGALNQKVCDPISISETSDTRAQATWHSIIRVPLKQSIYIHLWRLKPLKSMLA